MYAEGQSFLTSAPHWQPGHPFKNLLKGSVGFASPDHSGFAFYRGFLACSFSNQITWKFVRLLELHIVYRQTIKKQ